MKIRLVLSKKDKEKVNKRYNTALDWRLLSYCLTTSYNWIVPNRKDFTNDIRVAVSEKDEECYGWFKFGMSIYVNPAKNETIDEFIKTLFHEFCHWHQYWVKDRSYESMVFKSPKKWSMDQCEEEAEKWETIGKNAFTIYNLLQEGKELV